MKTRNLSVRISVLDGDKVRRELTLTGEEGHKALLKIQNATKPASSSLKALDSVCKEMQDQMESLSGQAGSLGSILTRLGPVGLGAAAAIGAITLGIGGALRELAEFNAAQTKLQAILRATDYSAGLTAREIGKLADAIEDTTLSTAENAKDAASALLAFENIGSTVFANALTLSADLSAAMGIDMVTAAQQLGRALEHPEDGLGRLATKGRDLSAAQKDLINDLMETGQVAEAQAIIIDALSNRVGGTASAQNSGLTGAVNTLGDAWGDLLEAFGHTLSESGAAQTGINLLTKALTGLRLEVRQTTDEALKDIDQRMRLMEKAGTNAFVFDLVENPAYSSLREQRKTLEEQLRQDETESQNAWLKETRAAATRRTDAVIEIERKANETLKSIVQTERDKIYEESANAKRRLAGLRNIDGSNDEDITRATEAIDSVAKARLEKLDTEAAKSARDLAKANETLITTLEKRLSLENIDDPKKRFIAAEVDKLSANASAEYRHEVERLAGALYDKQEAEKQAKDATASHAKALEDIRTRILETLPTYESSVIAADDWKTKTIEALDETSAEYDTWIAQVDVIHSKLLKDAYDKSLNESKRWEDGMVRSLKRYAEEAGDAAKHAEQVFGNAAKGIADYLTDALTSGEFSMKGFRSLLQSIQQDLMRSVIQQNITGPLSGALSSGLSSMFGGGAAGTGGGFFASLFHEGGEVGTATAQRYVPSRVFEHAPRLHNGLMPDEFPAILQKGETVLKKGSVASGTITVNMNISTPNAESFIQSRGQIMSRFASELERFKARNG